MKKLTMVTMITVILIVAFTATNCSVWKAERTYKIAKLKRAKNLLESRPLYTDSLGRESGIVSNMDRYRPIRIVILDEDSEEKKSYFLAPGQWLRDYLIGGDYKAVAYYENREVGRWGFKVGPDIHNFMGNEVHWFLVYSNGY